MFGYFVKLRTKLAIWKIPPTTHSNGKQNIQFQNRMLRQAELTATLFHMF